MGGYCTLDCDSDLRCGKGGECAVPAGEERGECLASGKVDGDCRDAYSCVGAGAGSGIMISGTCQPRPAVGSLRDGVVGSACRYDADCPGGECKSTTPLGMDLPDNSCSARCYEDSQCGSGGACLLVPGSTDPGHCYARCESDDDCSRAGYRCRRVGAELHACCPAPASLPDFTAGRACANEDDCGGAADSCARMLPYGSWGGNDVVEAPGGYCTQPCMLDSECGQGARCISSGAMGGMCLSRCTGAGDCRQGYTCSLHGRDLNIEDQVCVPLLP